jgi:hypothetical protein
MVPAAHRNGFANQAAARDGWTPIPETMTAGIHAQLAIDGFAACQNARAARDALQAANGPESHSAPRSISIQSGRLTLLESAGWEHVSPRPALDARRSLVDVPVASFPSRSIGRP